MISSVKIGDIIIPHGLFLAPMAGMTDESFRKIARQAGAEYCISEMISSIALVYKDEKTFTLAKSDEMDSPLAIQIFGHDPEIMSKATEILLDGQLEKSGLKTPAAIDINMGCPVKKIYSNGDGSALMHSPELVYDIVHNIAKTADKYNCPVTVKIRAGINKNSINAVDIALKAYEAGASAIYVHGRTKEQLYAPPVNLEIIKQVRDKVPYKIPVIGNGDIKSIDDAINMLNVTGCNGIMIGRYALGNPWIFEEIKAKMDNKTYISPSEDEKTKAAITMIEDMVNKKGEINAIREARGRAAYFIREKRGASKIREKLNHAETLDEFKNILMG